MVYESKPKNETAPSSNGKNIITIFLAGTIDDGNSVNWQKEVVDYFRANWKHEDIDLLFFNPRRDCWNSLDKDEMEYQIKWELLHQEFADINIMNILESSKSPISLMELGAFKDKKFVYVACPKEFYRFENVRVFCERYKIHHNYTDTSIQKVCKDLENLIEKAQEFFK